jgi:hypothetical protein
MEPGQTLLHSLRAAIHHMPHGSPISASFPNIASIASRPRAGHSHSPPSLFAGDGALSTAPGAKVSIHPSIGDCLETGTSYWHSVHPDGALALCTGK